MPHGRQSFHRLSVLPPRVLRGVLDGRIDSGPLPLAGRRAFLLVGDRGQSLALFVDVGPLGGRAI